MGTAAVFGIAVSWILTLTLVVALTVSVSRRRRAEARTSQDLVALHAQVDALGGQVAELTVREASQRRPESPPEVAVITGLSDRADDDLSVSRVASVTLAGPLLKVAALSYGVRHALHEEQRMRISYAMRKELRRQRKMRRRRRSQRSRSEGWVP